MSQEEHPIQHFEKQLKNYQPGISVDCIIFGYEKGELNVLLLKWKIAETWALPGGFVRHDEPLDEAALRVLEERTGLTHIYLKQFQTFGNMERTWNYSNVNKLLMDKMLNGIPFHDRAKVTAWFKQRFISVGYLALVDIGAVTPTKDFLSERCEWKPLDRLPQLMLDHAKMIEEALSQLKLQLNALPLGKQLLPKRFTMADLQALYEAVLQKPLDRGNFQRKMLALGFLIRHEKLMTGAQNKAPYLYSFEETKYNDLLHKGIGF